MSSPDPTSTWSRSVEQVNRYKVFLFIWLFIHQVLLFKILVCLIWNFLQVLGSSLILLIVDLCVLQLLDQRSLILNLFLVCDWKFPVGRIQTGHTDFSPPLVCGSSWRGFWFLWLLCRNQYIYWFHGSHKNQNPRHDLPQTSGGLKSVCPVWIRPTGNFQSHTRKSFRINERWSNNCNTHR